MVCTVFPWWKASTEIPSNAFYLAKTEFTISTIKKKKKSCQYCGHKPQCTCYLVSISWNASRKQETATAGSQGKPGSLKPLHNQSDLPLASGYPLEAVLVQHKVEHTMLPEFRKSAYSVMVMLMKWPKGNWEWGYRVETKARVVCHLIVPWVVMLTAKDCLTVSFLILL